MSDRLRKATESPQTRPAKARMATDRPRQAGGIEVTVNGVRVEVFPELEAAVHRAYKGLVRPSPKEMTTTQAAAFLDVSRPFVIKLIERGELPCRMVGTHRRIPGDALLAYREKMFQRARDAADEMARASQDLGLYDGEPQPEAK
jgi:excisionase family DNA binding protein